MKRWEQFNELLQINQNLEEHAIGIIVSKVREDIELNINQDANYYPVFIGMKEWLDEEVED